MAKRINLCGFESVLRAIRGQLIKLNIPVAVDHYHELRTPARHVLVIPELRRFPHVRIAATSTQVLVTCMAHNWAGAPFDNCAFELNDPEAMPNLFAWITARINNLTE